MPLSIVTVACCSAMAVLALLSGVIKSTTSNTRDRLNEITKEEERLTAEEEVLPTLRAEEIVPPRVTVSVPREDKENEKTPVKPKLTPLYAATSKRPRPATGQPQREEAGGGRQRPQGEPGAPPSADGPHPEHSDRCFQDPQSPLWGGGGDSS
ncbi:hypothetical protein ADEAN_000290900 [Angomonas deanei]|uniref:Secreted protein n=1 Tax=Angomonas deanei TaxID=59799 RepID=A0A7G2C8M0_9TRYP|nr:hypothetical protein ADEAN_000290900 [Angomonas deanei]